MREVWMKSSHRSIKMCVYILKGQIMSLDIVRVSSKNKIKVYSSCHILYLGSWIFSVQFDFYCTVFSCLVSCFFVRLSIWNNRLFSHFFRMKMCRRITAKKKKTSRHTNARRNCFCLKVCVCWWECMWVSAFVFNGIICLCHDCVHSNIAWLSGNHALEPCIHAHRTYIYISMYCRFTVPSILFHVNSTRFFVCCVSFLHSTFATA